MNAYDYALQSWGEALATLAGWAPGFSHISRPEQLNFDAVAAVMGAVPDGFQPIHEGLPIDDDALFLESALQRFVKTPSEVLVIPDCGMLSRFPFKLGVSRLHQFIEEYEHVSGSHTPGLLDGASDIFFAFDTGDMILVDHDERIWFSPSTPSVAS